MDLLRAARTNARRRLDYLRWRGSSNFWEQHYANGGNSGSGSFGRVAKFKADVLNGFVEGRNVESVVEFGCGDGNQLSLSRYPRYLGVDVASSAIDQCIRRFGDDQTKSFVKYDPKRWLNHGAITADLALSLEVIFHLVEDDVYETYMGHLFGAAARWVIVFSSNKDEPHPEPYARHRRFTDWVEERAAGWQFAERIASPFPYDPAAPFDTSYSDFWVLERHDQAAS